MSKIKMPKTYNPQKAEKPIYDWWERKGYFRPEINPWKKPFTITMPPPNVTGALHLGHAITAAVEDLVTRYHRMKGDPTLWLPGSDHAGIATQNVVERELAKEGLTRHDLGREKFIERVWQWKEIYHKRITDQHRRLGVSCDWERERFTLDEGLSRAVREAFVRLYKQGLIYRGTYLVNWCPRCTSAISDLEVVHEERTGKLWYVRYPLEGGGFIEVATTRPETILGDTAVAVHPDDERYTAMVGRTAILPILERRIPIIADEVVDPEFGTGAVKVTPGHDPTDYEIGQRHDLPVINVLNENGTMNEAAGPYQGQDRYECRKNLVADLEKAGLLVKVENYQHSLGHCQRCNTVIEPYVSTQWFVKIKSLADAALEAVRDGRIRIVPERFTKVYFNWLENIRDWCISRQLWWGHRIPVWYCDDCGGQTCEVTDPTKCAHCGSTNIRQDPDVLDTWFSSGLWPFSTLGWPEETEDFQYFYPTTMRETGYDILFFWVAREIMLGLAMTGQAPYSIVYLHGLIRNERGEKISKSMPDAEKYDPLNIVDEYGADALRFTLLTGSSPGNDMKLSLQRVEASRNFANKIWNAARFVVSHMDESVKPGISIQNLPEQNPVDKWIISRSNRLVADVTRLIEQYQYGEAGRQIYDFLWGEFCDWYIEMAKVRLYGQDPSAQNAARQVLAYVLERTMRLLHPFMPFVTEAIWQNLPHEGESIMIAPWPRAGGVDEEAETAIELLMDIVRAIRNARAEFSVQPKQRIAASIAAGKYYDLLREQQDILLSLAHLDSERLELDTTLTDVPAQALTLVVGGVTIYLPLAGMIDVEAEKARIANEMERLTKLIANSQILLTNKNFISKAPAHVVQKERDKVTKYREKWQKLRERLESLGGL
ncbi:MAG: valine--tRNA ligase [Anaerolineae bacterium]|nr:valine--tRNA ligase [Anaerolineae bacterium]